jgi:hypothetical protein
MIFSTLIALIIPVGLMLLFYFGVIRNLEGSLIATLKLYRKWDESSNKHKFQNTTLHLESMELKRDEEYKRWSKREDERIELLEKDLQRGFIENGFYDARKLDEWWKPKEWVENWMNYKENKWWG